MAYSNILPANCTVFVQLWVDSVAVLNPHANTKCYLIDNMVGFGSQNEATPNLNTFANSGANICWSIMDVNVNSGFTYQFVSFDQIAAWGTVAPGAPSPGAAQNVWTGNLVTGAWQNGVPYTITFDVIPPGQSPITVTVTPSILIKG